MQRSDGLVVRAATNRDLDQIADLLAARLEPADAVDLRLVVDDPDEGLEACGVVADGDRVVSTATLLREQVRVGSVDMPAGQIELVATDPEYEGRGLVRALVDRAHRISRERGDLLQVMIGIPYFYRQFGYAYALPIPETRPVVSPFSTGDDHLPQVRRATTADIPAMVALQDSTQQTFDVAMGHTAACWRWLVAREGTTQWVAERDGACIGTARTTPPEEGVVVAELATSEPAAARALVRHGAQLGDGAVAVQERPGSAGYEAVESWLGPASGRPEWYYARIERIGPLLLALGPTLAGRLAAAGITGTHEVLLSSWRTHVVFEISPEGVTGVREGGAEQSPISKGGAAVPVDGIAPLVLGPEGAEGLERRMPDCMLGRSRELMSTLFPPVTADLLTFYLPV